jgi:hypothetical protein
MAVTVYVWRFRKRGLIGWGNVGHASIRVDRQSMPETSFYLSWWPAGDSAHGGFGKLIGAHTTSHAIQGSYGNKGQTAARRQLRQDMYHSTNDDGSPTFTDRQINKAVKNIQSDKMAEDGSADAKYKFNLGDVSVLSEMQMVMAFQSIHQGGHCLSTNGHAQAGEYSLVHQNCSTAVAWILEAGGAGKLAAKPAIKHFWTPNDIAKWCDRIVLAALEKNPGSATRTRGFTGNVLDFTTQHPRYPALATSS